MVEMHGCESMRLRVGRRICVLRVCVHACAGGKFHVSCAFVVHVHVLARVCSGLHACSHIRMGELSREVGDAHMGGRLDVYMCFFAGQDWSGRRGVVVGMEGIILGVLRCDIAVLREGWGTMRYLRSLVT